jgi:predicted nucleic acid-binding protein
MGITLPAFVIDASIILAWYDPRKTNVYADTVLARLDRCIAITPPLCRIEVNNLLHQLEKHGILSSEDVEKATSSISAMPILTDDEPFGFSMPAVLSLARRHDLTVYDACYLALAVKHKIPLASVNQTLIDSANAEGLALK